MRAAAMISSGTCCATVSNDLRSLHRQVALDFKHDNSLRIIRPFWQLAENLGGNWERPTVLTGEAMNEITMFQEAVDNALLLEYCRICQLQLKVYFGETTNIVELIEQITQEEQSFKLTFNNYFFNSFLL